ncbi:MAG: DUF2326 domain-containing protein [Bryobacterales bacterium]|nr:DUF2326 domain-containing protein [Bryobacterales bacterium]
MIQKISSDLESFKTLRFGPGLNVLLADKSRDASDRQSRNGAGKTSFVELVHFLFGGDAKPDSIFRSEALKESSFSAEVEIGGIRMSVTRSGRRPRHIQLETSAQGWPETLDPPTILHQATLTAAMVPGSDSADLHGSQTRAASAEDSTLVPRSRTKSNEEWKQSLGCAWYELPIGAESAQRFRPSFRSLFSFAARRQQAGGFQEPTKHSNFQQPWDQQISIAYLLGLDWTIPGQFQELKERERVVKSLRQAVRSGVVGSQLGTSADLRTKLTISEALADRARKQLERFQVVPRYRELEIEADEITARISDLNTENVVDRALLSELQSSITSEEAPGHDDISGLYAEAGIVLPGLPRRRLEEVATFHRAITENRRSHLDAEIASAKDRIAARDQTKGRLDQRRGQIMELLGSGGALEHYTSLREELGRVEGEVEVLRERLATTEQLESTQSDLKLERAKLVKALESDIHERREIIRDAILMFEDLSSSLYERALAGRLTVAAAPIGPKFEARIDSDRSKGITNMQIFCFDLMLAELRARQDCSNGFLIHDSHLFDGVDERQVAKALELGAERAETSGFQYIVTMNSDAVPREGFKAGFDLSEYYMEARLTDATEDGGLFGLRFN